MKRNCLMFVMSVLFSVATSLDSYSVEVDSLGTQIMRKYSVYNPFIASDNIYDTVVGINDYVHSSDSRAGGLKSSYLGMCKLAESPNKKSPLALGPQSVKWGSGCNKAMAENMRTITRDIDKFVDRDISNIETNNKRKLRREYKQRLGFVARFLLKKYEERAKYWESVLGD